MHGSHDENILIIFSGQEHAPYQNYRCFTVIFLVYLYFVLVFLKQLTENFFGLLFLAESILGQTVLSHLANMGQKRFLFSSDKI